MKINPSQLKSYLTDLITHKIDLSAMIWGAPGIGKSSIVRQVAEEQGLCFVDVRLSQLAPTDLRGLPVPKDGITCWAPPEFLPRAGKGILFLDEVNMAPPAMQGVAQQLILDRRVGNYTVPGGWFVWAAGNRKIDRASVFDMPAPLANRFIHLELEPCVENFRLYAFRHGFNDHIVAFVAFRHDLLHKVMPNETSWPSPRSWEMANKLHQANLNIEPAVGVSSAAEFYAFLDVVSSIPDINGIVFGSKQPPFPEEVSLRYATVMSLVGKIASADHALNALRWLIAAASPEWVQLFATDAFPLLREKKLMADVQAQVMKEEKLKSFLVSYARLIGG